MSERIFFQTPSFLAGIEALNRAADEAEPVSIFVNLLAQNDRARVSSSSSSDLLTSTLADILERVAYFPLRPSDMQVQYWQPILYTYVVRYLPKICFQSI